MAIVVVFAIGPLLAHWLAKQSPRVAPAATADEGITKETNKGRGPLARATLG